MSAQAEKALKRSTPPALQARKYWCVFSGKADQAAPSQRTITPSAIAIPSLNENAGRNSRVNSIHKRLPASSATASGGLEASASSPSAPPHQSAPCTGQSRLRTHPESHIETHANCMTSGVVSWPRSARPKQASRISSAPSAIVRPSSRGAGSPPNAYLKGCTSDRRPSRSALHPTKAQPMQNRSAVAMRAASAGVSQNAKRRMLAAPGQYPSGPLPVMAFPSRLGNSQSCQPPSASVHMTPNPAASSFFHGSRPHSPDKAYTTQIARSIQRGNTGVTEAVRRTMAGFMRALPDAGGQAL